MGRNYKKIIEARPELEDDDAIIESSDSLDAKEEMETFALSDDGQKIIQKLRKDCAIELGNLVASYSIQDTYEKLYALIADFHARLKLLDSIANAPSEAEEMRNIIDEIIKERI